MELSTYGMWEQERENLAKALSEDVNVNCSMEQINKALFGPVITVIVDTSFKFHQQLTLYSSTLDLRGRMLLTYKEGLLTTLATLARSLNRSEELLQPHTNQFIFECLKVSKTLVDYLSSLAKASQLTKTITVAQLYGADFSTQYPELARKLFFNDKQVIEQATKAVTKEINGGCPVNIRPRMAEHIKYMNEITAQKWVSPEFEQQFKQITGMTMDEYKAQVKLSRYVGQPLTSLLGHFKMRQELKSQPVINVPKL